MFCTFLLVICSAVSVLALCFKRQQAHWFDNVNMDYDVLCTVRLYCGMLLQFSYSFLLCLRLRDENLLVNLLLLPLGVCLLCGRCSVQCIVYTTLANFERGFWMLLGYAKLFVFFPNVALTN